MRSRRIGAAMALVLALWQLAPGAADAQLAAPLDTVPRLFASGAYREAAAIVLEALAQAESEASARDRNERAGVLVQAYADSGRYAEAERRVAPTLEQRGFNLAQIASSAAIDGDVATARRYLSLSLNATGGGPRDGFGAAVVAETQARLGGDELALFTARLYDDARALALARVALAGPSGRPGGAPEQAWAEMRGFDGTRVQRIASGPYILATLARAAVRNGEGNSALDRAASIENAPWRATAFAWAAAELAAWQMPGLANQGLRRAEETARFDRAAAPVVIAERVQALPLTWIAYAYARMGEQDQAQRAMEALLLTGAAGKDAVRRMEALAYAANAIGRTRQHVAEAEARARAVRPPAPAPGK